MENNKEMTNEELVENEAIENVEDVCSGNDYNVAIGLALGTLIGVIGTLIVPKVKRKIEAVKSRRAARKGGVVNAEFEETKDESEDE